MNGVKERKKSQSNSQLPHWGSWVTVVAIDQETENRPSGGSVVGAGRVGLGQRLVQGACWGLWMTGGGMVQTGGEDKGRGMASSVDGQRAQVAIVRRWRGLRLTHTLLTTIAEQHPLSHPHVPFLPVQCVGSPG